MSNNPYIRKRIGWWASGKAVHRSRVGPFTTAVEAAEYAERYMPVAEGWSHVRISYNSTGKH